MIQKEQGLATECPTQYLHSSGRLAVKLKSYTCTNTRSHDIQGNVFAETYIRLAEQWSH
jgi:hypothetical protein